MSRVEPNRNVYVGHRYVPKIFGEWDKQNQYEGLSIVTHQGNSYTSKKRVPVGIDILNEEFWVVTGNYNAQVEDYRKEVRDLSTYVDTELDKKSDQTYVDTELGKKANKTYVDTELAKKSDKTYVDTELGKKSDKTYVDTELGKKADTSFVDTELDKKADVITERVDYYIPDDYPSLQSALNDITKKHSSGVRVGITIKSGHVPKLKIMLRDTVLPNVSLNSEDEIVKFSDELSPTDHLFDIANTYGFQLHTLINMEGKGGHGIHLHGGSYMRIGNGKGIINAGDSCLNVREGSTAYAYGGVFTGASQNSTDGAGITCWGGTVIASFADVSDSKAYGARSAHGGTLDFDNGTANDVAYHGIRASQNGRVTCRYATVNNAGIHGLYALSGSQMNATTAVIKNAGNTGVYASEASMINADRSDIDGCEIGCRAWYGSTINFNSGVIKNCTDTGVSCTLSSTIEARNLNLGEGALTGIRADESSSINAQSCTVYGARGTGVRATNNSKINIRASTIRNTQPGSLNAHGVVSDSMSTISVINGTVWNNGGNDLRVDAGGSIGANGCRTTANVGTDMPSEPSTEDINISSFNNFSRLGYILN